MAPHADSNLAVVLNGRAKSVNDTVVDLVQGLVPAQDLYVSRSMSDARRIVRTIVERRYRTVLTGGGDGTFAAFATHLETHLDAEDIENYLPRLGMLKLGTGNALASTFGAAQPDRRIIERDLDYAANGARTRPMRFIDVEGKVAPFAGIGLDALILNSYRIVLEHTSNTPAFQATEGLAGYALAIAGISLPQYLTEKVPDAVILNEGGPAWRVGPDGKRVGPMILKGEVIYRGPARLAASSKLPYYGFDFRLFPFAMLRDDRFHLRVSDAPAQEILANLPAVWKGQYFSRTVHDFLAERVSIHLSCPSPFQIGGDGEGYRSYINMNLRQRPYELIDFRHLSRKRTRPPVRRPWKMVTSALRAGQAY
jgi:diacylglycerol kinase family enzyme